MLAGSAMEEKRRWIQHRGRIQIRQLRKALVEPVVSHQLSAQPELDGLLLKGIETIR
jgi:hypothetical protein